MNHDPNRSTAIERCQNLEKRFIRIQNATGGNYSIGINWAREWAMAMIEAKQAQHAHG